jgi:hypothetical protein
LIFSTFPDLLVKAAFTVSNYHDNMIIQSLPLSSSRVVDDATIIIHYTEPLKREIWDQDPMFAIQGLLAFRD